MQGKQGKGQREAGARSTSPEIVPCDSEKKKAKAKEKMKRGGVGKKGRDVSTSEAMYHALVDS